MIRKGDLSIVARQYAAEKPRQQYAPLIVALADELDRVRNLYRNSAGVNGCSPALINEMLYPGTMKQRNDKDVLQPDAGISASGAASDQ